MHPPRTVPLFEVSGFSLLVIEALVVLHERRKGVGEKRRELA